MIGALKTLTKRPTDKTIRIIKVVFGTLLVSTLAYNLVYQGDAIESNFFGYSFNEVNINYMKYIIVAIGIPSIIIGAFNLNILKSKYTRIAQIFFGILLFYISSKIVKSADLEIDTLVFLMAFFPILAGITGKLITKSGLRHGEKITKIRV